MKTYSKKLFLMTILGVLMLLAATTAMAGEDPRHPCHQGGSGGPGGPGSPPAVCPPTPEPGDPLGPTSGGPPVGFQLINASDQPITLWLGSPVQYVLNLAPNSAKYYTVSRNVYEYNLRSCGQDSTGYMTLTIQTYFQVDPCRGAEHLVRVNVQNRSEWSMEVIMSGYDAFVFYLAPGQTRSLTIPWAGRIMM